MNMQLKGIIPPVTTPFDINGKIDEVAFCKDIDYLLQVGVHGLAVGGSTGEGHTLSSKELVGITQKAMKQVSGKIPVIAGIIADFHLHNVRKPDWRDHRSVTDGVIDFSRLFTTLKEIGYSGLFDIELEEPEREKKSVETGKYLTELMDIS